MRTFESSNNININKNKNNNNQNKKVEFSPTRNFSDETDDFSRANLKLKN